MTLGALWCRKMGLLSALCRGRGGIVGRRVELKVRAGPCAEGGSELNE